MIHFHVPRLICHDPQRDQTTSVSVAVVEFANTIFAG